MKKLTHTIVFALLAGCALAQGDYQLFRPDVQYLYANPLPQDGYVSPLLGVRVGEEPCAYTYESILPMYEEEQPGGYCYRRAPAFVGRYVCQGDELTRLNIGTEAAPQYVDLRPNAALGEVWLVTDAPYSIYGRADSVRWENTLGLWDSVKYIGLYALDSAEELVPVSADGPIKVSKQYGLVRGVFVPTLTEGLGALELVGMSHPEVGFQNPDRAAIFQLQVGDTLHIRNYNTVTLGETWAHVTALDRAVLEQVWWGADTLHHVFRSERRISAEGPGSNGTIRYETGVRDTFVWALESLEYLDFQPGTLLADVSFDAQVVSLRPIALCAPPVMGKHLGQPLVEIEEGDGCLVFLFDTQPGPTFMIGLAGPYYGEVGLGGYRFRELLYAGLLDGTSCGTPFDFIVGVQSPQAADELSLWPQPVRDVLQIRWPEAATTATQSVELWSSQGQLLRRYRVSAPLGTIDMSGLPAGTYWLRLPGGQRAWPVVKL